MTLLRAPEKTCRQIPTNPLPETALNKINMTGAILAGGQSRRMGFNKAFISTGEGAIIERTVRLISSVFKESFIVANDAAIYKGLGLPVYTDIISGAGSLGGIYTAIFHSGNNYTFVVACDMPYLDEACVRAVAERTGKAGSVAPFIGGMLHPMHAAYSKRCLTVIEKHIKAGDLMINTLLDEIDTLRLTEDDFPGLPIARSVENVNTKDDLRRTGLDGE